MSDEEISAKFDAIGTLLSQLFVQQSRNDPAQQNNEILANWESIATDILKERPSATATVKNFYAEVRSGATSPLN